MTLKTESVKKTGATKLSLLAGSAAMLLLGVDMGTSAVQSFADGDWLWGLLLSFSCATWVWWAINAFRLWVEEL